MKRHILAAASGVALCAFLMSSPAGAQGSYPAPNGDRVDADGMPTTHSTPQEKAQTNNLNAQVANSDGVTTAQSGTGDAQYQAQQQQYQQQQQQYQDQMRQHQNQVREHEAAQEHYEDRTAHYESLRARYAAERAAYHRDLWPERHWVMIEHGADLAGQRVELISGNRVGTVVDTAHAANGDVEALLVRLDNDKVVWIDNSDIRYDRADGVVMTDLRFDDLRHMADERL